MTDVLIRGRKRDSHTKERTDTWREGHVNTDRNCNYAARHQGTLRIAIILPKTEKGKSKLFPGHFRESMALLIP